MRQKFLHITCWVVGLFLIFGASKSALWLRNVQIRGKPVSD